MARDELTSQRATLKLPWPVASVGWIDKADDRQEVAPSGVGSANRLAPRG